MAQPSTPPIPPPYDPPFANHPVNVSAATAPAAVRPIREWIVLGAGVVAVIGSFLPWAKVSAPILGTISRSGVDGSDGWITVGLGLLLVLYGGMRLRGLRTPVVVPILAGLAAAGLFWVGVWKIANLWEAEAVMQEEMSAEDDPLGIGKAMSAATQVNVGSGLWLLTFAGFVGAVATVLVMLRRSSK